MRTIFGVRSDEAGLFLGCALLCVLIVMLWTAVPLVPSSAISDQIVSVADSDMAFLQSTGLFGDLPAQSISKLVVCIALYICALLYALLSVLRSEGRRVLLQVLELCGLGVLGWSALNWWVIAGFLNAAPLYGVAAAVSLALWADAVRQGVAQRHAMLALFLVRFGLGLSMFIAIVQIAALLTPGWRSPNQGIPIIYNLTVNALIGVFLAGAGANMRLRERRELAIGD